MAFNKYYEQPKVEFNNTLYCPVSVNVTFNVLGEMRPDYVQIVQADESKETFKIYSAKLQKQIEAYIQYVCTIVSNNCTREIKLTYFKQDHVWCIEK